MLKNIEIKFTEGVDGEKNREYFEGVSGSSTNLYI
jgi:hypothetical protein